MIGVLSQTWLYLKNGINRLLIMSVKCVLREKKPDTKVVVGGAVMTPEYSEQIGADAYAKDAMATVRYCDTVFEG